MLGKFPPIEGGVSRNNDLLAASLSRLGHTVLALSNSGDFVVERLMYGPHNPDGYTLYNIGKRIAATPHSNGEVTRLISRGLEICEANDVDLVIASYLEPYGIAALFIHNILRIPYAFIHAGSDIGRLYKEAALKRAYTSVFTCASLVLTNLSKREMLLSIGCATTALVPNALPRLDAETFNANKCDFSIDSFLDEYRLSFHYSQMLGKVKIPNKFNSVGPSFFMYGKLAASKGIYRLIAAFKKYIDCGGHGNLYFMCHGDKDEYVRFFDILRELELQDRVFNFPFVQNRLIPCFIKLMDLVLFLESSFSIATHSPIIPLEVVSCGKPLMLSEEIYAKQSFFGGRLVANSSVLVARERLFEEDIVAAFHMAEHSPGNLTSMANKALSVVKVKRSTDDRDASSAALISAFNLIKGKK